MFQELMERRVPQILGAYLLGGWGLIQFIAFLEERYELPRNLVDATGLFLVLLVPAVAIFAWTHGRPGPDRWSRRQLFLLGGNLGVATVLGLIVLGSGPGQAQTNVVTVQDEHGATTRRLIPASESRHRLIVYPFADAAGDSAGWVGGASALGLVMDLYQDILLSTMPGEALNERFRDSGFEDASAAPAALQRRIAGQMDYQYAVRGEAGQEAGGDFVLRAQLMDIERGTVASEHELRGPELLALVDQLSAELRAQLPLPEWEGEGRSDLPVREILTGDVAALREFIEGYELALRDGDFAGARPHFDRAGELDPTFALAHFYTMWTAQQMQDMPAALAASDLAMQHLYRLPERSQFAIKSMYYFLRQENDKGMAVLEMWAQLWPSDNDAWRMLATFRSYRGDIEGALLAHRRVLENDPRASESLRAIAGLEEQRGDVDAALAALQELVEQDPSDVDALLALGRLHQEEGRLPRAQELLERAQLLDPNRLETGLALADCARERGRPAEAERILRGLEGRATSPNQEKELADAWASLRGWQGRVEEAMGFVDQWRDAAMGTANQLDYLISWCVRQGRLEELEGGPALGLARLDSALATITEPYRAMGRMGKVPLLRAIGQVDSARSTLDEIEELTARLGFSSWEALISIERAEFAELEGELGAALELRQQARSFQARRVGILREIARLHRLMGDLDEARELMEALVARAPFGPRTRLEAAELALARGDEAAAREHLGVVLEIWSGADPGYRPARRARELAERLGVAG